MSERISAPDAPPGNSELSGTYHTVHDREDGPLSEAVYSAVADAVGIDPGRRPIPIADTIDPDGLDEVLQDGASGAYVSFPVWDLEVVVHDDGHIFVHPTDREYDDV
jgi:hypothetical protein